MSLELAVQSLSGKRLLIASDFDGTLAELIDRPRDVVANQRAVTALIELASNPEITVAVVSGRSRDDLVTILGESGDVILIGEHGADTGSGEVGDTELIQGIARQLNEIASDFPGTEVEVKRMSVVFHYRRATGDVSEALDEVRRTAGPEVLISQGKKVVEVHVSTITKGDAIETLRKSCKADAVVFIGDDTTDESVFTRLVQGDVGVKVGEGETAAQHRLPAVADVGDFLRELSVALG